MLAKQAEKDAESNKVLELQVSDLTTDLFITTGSVVKLCARRRATSVVRVSVL